MAPFYTSLHLSIPKTALKKLVLLPALLLLSAVVFAQAPGRALNFDGFDDYVTINRPVSGDFTIEFWMNTAQYNGASGQWYDGNGLIDGDVAGDDNDFGISLLGGKIAFGTADPTGVGSVTITSYTDVTSGRWVHVAVTRRQSTGEMKLYINGVLEATGTGGTNTLNAATTLSFGALNTLNNFFEGSLDEVRIFNTVKTGAGITADMVSVIGSPSADASVVGYYNMDEGIAEGDNTAMLAITDQSANINGGTLNSFDLTGSVSNFVESFAMIIPVISTPTNITGTGFTANWSAPTIGAAGHYVFQVANDRCFTDILWDYSPPVDVFSTSYDVAGLTPGKYYYRVAADTISSLSGQGTYSADSVTIVSLPTATISGDATVCSAYDHPEILFAGSDGTAPYTFAYTVNGGSVKTITTHGTDDYIYLPVTRTNGSFTYSLVSVTDANGLTQPQSSTAIIAFTLTANTTRVSLCQAQLPFTWNGTAYYKGGYYEYITTNAAGCDSIAKLVLTVTGTSTTIAVVKETALPYHWNGKDYLAGGVYTYTTTGAGGCDSVATLKLTVGIVHPPAAFTYTTPNVFTKGTGITDLSPASVATGTPKVFGPAFSYLYSTAVDGAGNVYAGDVGNFTLTKIAPNGTTTVFGEGLVAPSALAVDASGVIYFVDAIDYTVKKVETDGTISTFCSTLSLPIGLVADNLGNVFATDGSEGAVMKINAAGDASVFWRNDNGVGAITIDTEGNLYVSDNAGFISKVSSSGNFIAAVAKIKDPLSTNIASLAADNNGNVYASDPYNSNIFKILPNGRVTVYSTSFNLPVSIAIDLDNNLYVGDLASGLLSKVSLSGNKIKRYTVSPALPEGLAIDKITGVISGTPATATPETVYTVTGINDKGSISAEVSIAVQSATASNFSYNTGNLFVKNRAIRDLQPIILPKPLALGEVGLINNSLISPEGLALDADNNIYVADPADNAVKKISPDGLTVTQVGPNFNQPINVAVSPTGLIYVAEFGANRIKRINLNGTVTNLTSGFHLDGPSDVALDASGNLYIADTYKNAIRRRAANGDTLTLAAFGCGCSGLLSAPTGIDVAGGYLYIADNGHDAIKRMSLTAPYAIETVMDTGLYQPADIKVDASGNIFIADQGNSAVKVITFPGGVPTLTTLGYGFSYPGGISVDAEGSVYVADSYNGAIKKIGGAGQVVGNYAISPALPEGLTINPASGYISGTPLASSPLVGYTITASKPSGANFSTTTDITINVADTIKAGVCSPASTYYWALTGASYGPGYYNEVLSNAGGFDSSIVLAVKVSAPATATLAGVNNINLVCYGGTRKLLATVTGGTKPYMYSIDGGATFTSSRSFLQPAGTYSVIVQDSNLCTITTNSITLTEPAEKLGISLSRVNASCNGAADGSITVNATNGFGTYTYSINGGSFIPSNNFGSLAAGSYKLAVNDGGCTVSRVINVTEPATPCAGLMAGKPEVTSAKAAAAEMQVKVYPNPAVIDFNLQIVSGGDAKNVVELRVMDMTGKTLYQTKGSVYDTYRFGRTFASGMYIAEVLNGKNVNRIKLVKGN